ncbi:MAG: SUMF1/EgtB/PvdO family nonheme iron enzyme, partial [Bacteroidaceae bacterium]|nr:SUMF1/EgtB/PvdO family nonheme iron enzyme [Bacteroidaceae bacterium]
NLTFDNGQLGIVRVEQKKKQSEWWVYVPEGTEKLKIAHPQYGQLNTGDGFIHFAPLKRATVYRLELRTPQMDALEQIDRDGFLILETQPAGAQVYLTRHGVEEYIGLTPVQKKLHYGNYVYRIVMPNYQNAEGVITIDAPTVHERKKLESQLFAVQDNAAFGELTITTYPFYADVSIDGQNVGTTPMSYNLPVGEYEVVLSKQGFNTVSQHVNVVEDEIMIHVDLQQEGSSTPNNASPKREIEQKTEPVKQEVEIEEVIEEVVEEVVEEETVEEAEDNKKENVLSVENKEILPEEIQKLLENMVFVEGGKFRMGAQSSDPTELNYDQSAEEDEAPVHFVTLSDYYICKYEVTQALWTAVMGSTLEMEKFNAGMQYEGSVGVGDDYPMYYVGNGDAKVFCRNLSALTGKKFRLPTEAEWEYAARGGNKSRGYRYSGSNKHQEVADRAPEKVDKFTFNFGTGNYTAPKGIKLSRVGKKRPNELGIYDMSGNVWEWCSDIFGDYEDSPQTNPKGLSLEKGKYHILRGGSSFYPSHCSRVTYREGAVSGTKNANVGFRVVCEP